MIEDVENWPQMLRVLVVEHGPRLVWLTGLGVLGYPPLWVTGGSELVTLHSALQR